MPLPFPMEKLCDRHAREPRSKEERAQGRAIFHVADDECERCQAERERAAEEAK